MDLQDFLNSLSNEGSDPGAVLADVPADELGQLESELLNEFNGAAGSDALTDGDVDQLEALATGVEVVRGESERRDAEAAARADRVAQISARVTPAADPESGSAPVEDDEDEDTEGEEEGDGEDADGQDPDAVTPGQGGPVEMAPAVAATLKRPKRVDLAGLRARGARAGSTPRLPARTPGGRRAPAVRAAANVPGIPIGRDVTLTELAAAATTQFSAAGGGIGGRHQFGLARIERHYPADLVADDRNEQSMADLIAHAADVTRLPGNSLVAAGGWCAPSETIYDIATFATATGILSTPEIAVHRGGLRWPSSPDFSALYSGTGFVQTEAQNLAGATKPCYEIPCPSFREARLDAIGLCLTAGILQQKGYPEQVAAYIAQSLIAHTHRINAEKIKRMAAQSTALTATSPHLGVMIDSLDILEMHIEDIRYKYRLAPTDELEAVLPLWFRPILRTDLQRRNFLTDPNVADSALNDHFAQRYVNAQWVYDWQDAMVNDPAASDAGLFGGSAPIGAYPTSVQVMLYPAGTWIVANDPIITLDGIYDSTNIRQNGYTALFTEESIMVAQRNLESRLISIPIDRRLPTS